MKFDVSDTILVNTQSISSLIFSECFYQFYGYRTFYSLLLRSFIFFFTAQNVKLLLKKSLMENSIFCAVFIFFYKLQKLLRFKSLKVVSAKFWLVCLISLKQSTREGSKNVFCFTSRALLLTFQMFKCHHVIKCLSMKHETHFTE